MIEQQINLYQDQFREKKTLVSAGQLATLVILVAIAMVAYSLFIQMEYDKASDYNFALKDRQQRIAEKLNSANAELSKLLADNRIDEEIAGVSREIGARRKVLNFVDSNQFGSGEGFSSYLVSLSNLHTENVWLDEIMFADNYVRIHGSALDAELVPVYFDRFSEESVFEGKRFDVFKLERDENTDWKVDFEIATREVPGE